MPVPWIGCRIVWGNGYSGFCMAAPCQMVGGEAGMNALIFRRRLRVAFNRLWFLLLLLSCGAAPSSAVAGNSAVVLMYHRFGEAAYPATNIRLEQFDAHLAELASGKYRVLALTEIIEAIAGGRDLPDRAVAITIDDAYLSVYSEAWPRLKKAGFPLTLFVSTTPIDRGLGGLMTWAQIRALQAAGVTIGHHAAGHAHMAGMDGAERDIASASARFRAEIGQVPKLFAYPYGEAGSRLQGLVRAHGFTAAFGQHSGAFDATANRFYLPRFPLNEKYGGLERFRLIANALALPVADETPEDPFLSGPAGTNPPAIGFTLLPAAGDAAGINCFASDSGPLRPLHLGAGRIGLQPEKPMPEGRSRINCTLRAAGDRWRWYGRQFYVAPN